MHPFWNIVYKENKAEGAPLSRKDRNPCPRLTLPLLEQKKTLVSRIFQIIASRDIFVHSSRKLYIPSSFFSSAAGVASVGAAPPAPPAPAPAPAGAAAPAEPTFVRRSLTSLPSRAFQNRNESAFSLFRVSNIVPCVGIPYWGYWYLGEKGGPDGLDILDVGSLQDALELVGLKTIVERNEMVSLLPSVMLIERLWEDSISFVQ